MQTGYAVITPARNEEDFIELTLKSMAAQTIRPARWVIVDDGSSDQTAEIVEKYAVEAPWIELLRRPPGEGRNFGAKVHAFNAGYDRLADLDYEFIANVDADISFDPDLFEFLLRKFDEQPRLGLAGVRIIEDGYDSFRDSRLNDFDVAGACQVFRREVFESFGGYQPISLGGIDWAAVRRVRMAGFETIAFPEKGFFHYRPMGSAAAGVWAGRFNYGRRDFRFGNHPLWELFRVNYQMTRRPYVLGGVWLGAGYLWSALKREPRVIPDDLVGFHRQEQLQRLKGLFSRKAARSSHARTGTKKVLERTL